MGAKKKGAGGYSMSFPIAPCGKIAWLTTLLLAGAAPARLLPAATFNVYILTGQSNSLGTTGLESAHAPGFHPADQQTSFFWSNVSSSNTTYPPLLYGHSGGAITTLQVQQGDGGVNPTFWGPEVGFARSLFDHGQSNVMIIKTSRGGGGNSLWDETSFELNANSGHMWGHLRDMVDQALAAIVQQGDAFQVKGLLYQQGESNSASESAIAGDRIASLADNLKQYINAAYPHTADAMHTAIAEIAASQSTPSRQTTTQLQSAMAAERDDFSFIATRDLPLKSDGIHFGRDAKLAIGARLADVFIAISEQPNAVLGDVNQDGVLFGDGTGDPELDDVASFIANWRSVTTGLTNRERTRRGDLNLDGATNLADALILHHALAAQGGALTFSTLTEATVPEPGAAALAIAAAALAMCSRLRRRTCIAALLMCLVVASSGSAADVEVYILTGQSNSLGTTADSSESSVTPGSHAADATTRLFWSNVSSVNATYPIGALYGNSGGAIVTLQTQQGDNGANATFWGPEFGFARAMADAGHANVMVIKASRGGGGNTLWSKAAFQGNANSGHMYQHILDTVGAATAELAAAGHTFRIAGLLYLQGESDSAAEAPLAGQRIDELVNNLRIDLPQAATMHAVIGGIAAAGATRDLVRAQQSARALADPTIDYFSNLDLADSLYDGLHFNKSAKLEIGRRFAQRFRQAAGELPLIEPTDFAAVAGAADATRLVFDHYVPDVDGPSPGTNLAHAGVFSGFADGVNGQPRVGVLAATSDGSVIFGDRHPAVPSSDLIVGSVALPNPPPRIVASAIESEISSGRLLSLTFVDPLDLNRPATVSSVAFELGHLVPEDQATATFLDVHGNVLHRTGELSNGAFGFVSRSAVGGAATSNIHQVVIAGSSTAGWTLGHASDVSVADLAFQGFRVVPEPTGCALTLAALFTLAVGRRRRCH